MAMPDWSALRAEFPALAHWTFLNSATFGQLPRRAAEAITAHLEHRAATACHGFLGWFDHHDRLREKLARLIHATPDDIAFTPNCATSLGLLMRGLDWREGDEIVTLEGEFPNQIYGPACLESRGVRTVETRWENFFEALSPRTRVVAISDVNYVTGFRAPVEDFAAGLERRGILLYLDGTQSLGALQFDFSAVRPAMYAVNCYKWMLAPNGVAFMAVREDLRQRLEPAAIGWRSHRGWRTVDRLHHGPPVFEDSAEKYEGGMLASLLLYALEASADLLLETGPAAIERRVLELARECRSRIHAAGGQPLPHRGSAIVSASFPGRDARVLAAALEQHRVLVSARHGLLRVSTHFYNDAADLARLESGLRPLL
jgi:selenocysteine lyase/cysteine desulfurase